jgi:hypothetical protein
MTSSSALSSTCILVSLSASASVFGVAERFVQTAPLKNQNPPVVVSKTNNPVAGEAIAVRWAEVMRGTSMPLSVALTSSMALAFGAAPSELMLVGCWRLLVTWAVRKKGASQRMASNGKFDVFM